MKNVSFTLFVVFLLMALSGFSQRPTIELSFSAQYQSQHVMLDSIFIQNLTQPGDTMLFAPDTVLLLDYIIGIPDYVGDSKSSFSVSPNYPNPSVDGKTSIDIFIPIKEFVTMRVFDIIGNEVAFYENKLDAGNHHFTVHAGKEKYYVLSVTCGNEVRSVMMINSGNSHHNQGSLIYEGRSEREPTFKSQKEIAGFGFSLGDQLRFIGYAKSPMGLAGSDVIEATPEGNENYVFEILEGLPCPGIPTVSYEGQTYKTVLISAQCWFKENLNVGTMINGSQSQSNNGTIEKYCYANNQANCETFGGLYQWDEMMQYSTAPGVQGICPEGWHLPTLDEWSILTDYVSSQPEFLCDNIPENIAKSLASVVNWNTSTTICAVGNNQAVNNASGLTSHPGGIRHYDGIFHNINVSGTWWTSNWNSTDYSHGWFLVYSKSYVTEDLYWREDGQSVRCLKNVQSATTPTVTTSGITDITQITATGGGEVTSDGGAEVTARGVCWSTSQNPTIADSHTEDGTGTGVFVSNLTGLTPNTPYYLKAYATNSVGTVYGNEVSFTTLTGSFTCGDVVTYEGHDYNTVEIGTQCWFKENLNVGTMIQGVSGQTNNGIIEKYCYDNLTSNCDGFGGLYQWDEMMGYTTTTGVKGICPDGWHIPTDEEWCTITQFIDPTVNCSETGWSGTDVGIKMKSTTGWNSNGNGTNESGFTGLPCGFRISNGSFFAVGEYGYWWSSTENSTSHSWFRYLYYEFENVGRNYPNKDFGHSVRCLKD